MEIKLSPVAALSLVFPPVSHLLFSPKTPQKQQKQPSRGEKKLFSEGKAICPHAFKSVFLVAMVVKESGGVVEERILGEGVRQEIERRGDKGGDGGWRQEGETTMES